MRAGRVKDQQLQGNLNNEDEAQGSKRVGII